MHFVKREYLQDVTFKSETDTEVIVQFIEKIAAEGLDVEEAFRKTVSSSSWFLCTSTC